MTKYHFNPYLFRDNVKVVMLSCLVSSNFSVFISFKLFEFYYNTVGLAIMLNVFTSFSFEVELFICLLLKSLADAHLSTPCLP